MTDKKWQPGIAITAALLVIGAAVFFNQAFRLQMPVCDSGPLTKIEKC